MPLLDPVMATIFPSIPDIGLPPLKGPSEKAKPRRCGRWPWIDPGCSNQRYHWAPMPAADLSLLLEQRFSVARLRPYREVVGGDLDAALALYVWNAQVAGAFFEDLGHLEVVLRNALHVELAQWHKRAARAGQWYDDPNEMLDPRRRRDIAEARARLARRRQPETPGKVIAELTFGFWRFLLDKHYQSTLWSQSLRRAFPHLQPQNRLHVYEPINQLHRLRNRIAHHEPIHHLPLPALYHDVLRSTGFIDPAIETWLAARSRVPQTLATRP